MYKHEYDKILYRIVEILSRLANGERFNANSVNELAKEFSVSTRTITRDFGRLRKYYPIHHDKKLKLWSINEGTKIREIATLEDKIIFDILYEITDSFGERFGAKAKAILGKIKDDAPNPIYAKLNMEDVSSKIDEISLLERAINSKKQIKCIYEFAKFTGEIVINPLKIANYEGLWYLLAIDIRDDKLKKYIIKKIQNIEITNNSFQSTKKIDELLENSINVWFEPKNEPFEVCLWVSEEAMKTITIKPISPTQKIVERYKDGSAKLSLRITHEMEIIGFVKYWIPHIRVISPSSIDETIKKDAALYIQLPTVL
ncbi:MAG: WYL domain-containing protein [Campylobacteraceae bacterium]|jgi:predicted DNA-binding transcriptional regulator YafY|nr:WYL domain-containing protein [Campylobacteraceae bacterium]